MPVIPTHGRLRQKDQEFEASLSHTARAYLKKKKKVLFCWCDDLYTCNPSYLGDRE
jgi:hypothetical protein